MAELCGKATGTCDGKGGSMHIADFDIGMLDLRMLWPLDRDTVLGSVARTRRLVIAQLEALRAVAEGRAPAWPEE